MRLANLMLIDDKILSQDGQRDYLFKARQLRQVSLEKAFIGEQRNRRRPGRFIDSTDTDRIGLLVDKAGRRRGKFYLGNQVDFCGYGYGGHEIAQRRQVMAPIERQGLFEFRHLVLLFFEYFF